MPESKILIYCSTENYSSSLKQLSAELPQSTNQVVKRDEFPKIDSLSYFDLILFSLNEKDLEQELALIRSIKAQYPGLELPLLLFGKNEEESTLEQLKELDFQDYIALPISSSFLAFRVDLHLKMRDNYHSSVERQQKLETEIQERTKKYRLAQLKAEESERLKTAFLNNLSHELRTPMNGILGFVDYLEDPDLESELRKKFIENIKVSSNRLLTTLRDLIEISEIEAGSIKAEKGPCNLHEIIEFLFELYQPRCDKKGLPLIQEFQLSEQDSKVWTDGDKIKSIFFHLLNNALKFSKQGTIRFGFRKEQDKLIGYVRDEGPGIAEEDQSLLTEQFTQLEDHLTRQHDGLGIGLSISKSFAESIGGSISFQSILGEGSTFQFEFPLEHYRDSSSSQANGSDPSLEARTLEVIIVDDDPINLQLMRKILEQKAHTLHEAANGVEAIKALEEHPNSDLILMDLKMPVMDGYEAVEEIRRSGNSIPIIAQTAYAMAVDKERALEAGCNDYISKPLNKSLLLQKVEQL